VRADWNVASSDILSARERSDAEGVGQPRETMVSLHKDGVPNMMCLHLWHTREHSIHECPGSSRMEVELIASSLHSSNMRTRISGWSRKMGELAFRRAFRDCTCPEMNSIS
jgi:hypothetical protein